MNGIAKNIPSVCHYCSVSVALSCCVPLEYNEHENIISVPCVFADIEDLPPAVQEKLFDEVLDRDVQKGSQDIVMFVCLHALKGWFRLFEEVYMVYT